MKHWGAVKKRNPRPDGGTENKAQNRNCGKSNDRQDKGIISEVAQKKTRGILTNTPGLRGHPAVLFTLKIPFWLSSRVKKGEDFEQTRCTCSKGRANIFGKSRKDSKIVITINAFRVLWPVESAKMSIEHIFPHGVSLMGFSPYRVIVMLDRLGRLVHLAAYAWKHDSLTIDRRVATDGGIHAEIKRRIHCRCSIWYF